MGLKLVAMVWGFAEATLFFIVPDVFTSAVALKELRRALMLCFWVLAGALLGGLIMYLWGEMEPERATEIVAMVPGVGAGMLDRVTDSLAEQGLLAVLLGPLSGTPYKTYAINAYSSGISLLAFMLISVPARLIRFIIVTTAAHLIARGLARYWPMTRVYALFGAAWAAFYVAYFAAHVKGG